MNKKRLQFLSLSVYLSASVLYAQTSQIGRDPFLSPSPPVSPAFEKEKKAIQSATPASLVTEIIVVRFASVDDLLSMIQGNGRGLLSTQGMASIDKRTNSLIIRDVPESVASIKQLVTQLDVPVKQVEIEARIVMMSEGAADELGVRWGMSSSQKYINIGGSLSQHDGADSFSDRLNVSLPASSNAASSIAFQLATLGSGTLLDLELSALQSESKAEVISSPRLLTTNRQSAFIEQGTEIPYLESNDDGENTIAFKKAVLGLKVTPYITPDHQLVLDLNVTQDRPGEIVKTGTGEAVAIVTQRLGTQVVVKNGETVVLGGIYQENNRHNVDKVPVLGDIPVVGSLFRRTYHQKGKSELLIFVTPTVVIQ